MTVVTAFPNNSIKDGNLSLFDFRFSVAGAFTFKHEAVVQDGQMVTSQCPGTAMAFGLKLVELLAGGEKMAAVEKGLHGR